MDWNTPRNTQSASVMCSAATEYGMTLELCLAGSGIDPASLEDPASEILPGQELTIIANIVRSLDRHPGIGLEMGARLHVSSFGILGSAMASCATLRELTEIGQRYSNILPSLTEKRYEIRGAEVRVTFDDQRIPPPLRRFVIERDLVWVWNAIREILPSMPFFDVKILFGFKRPDYAARYEEFFGLVPEFGCERTALITDVRALDLSLPQSNRTALRFWEAQLADLMARNKARSGIGGQVRAALLKDIATMSNMDAAARELGTSTRTLRRQLAVHGISFRGLVEQTRETIAEQLLASTSATVEEIAGRLGYTEISSFTNAFKRWKGVPPRDWRNTKAAREWKAGAVRR